MAIKNCQICGGLFATNSLEAFAGTPCQCFCRREAQGSESTPQGKVTKDSSLSEAETIEATLDRVTLNYPGLTRDKLREIFHATYDRVVEDLEVEEMEKMP